jgi:hypothetical protein
VEGLEESGRDRAASTSTSVTNAHNETVTNDSGSRAGNINFERTDSDTRHLPGTGTKTGKPTLHRRVSTYADYESPFENVVSDEFGADDYAQEMAYLLEQVSRCNRPCEASLRC